MNKQKNTKDKQKPKESLKEQVQIEEKLDELQPEEPIKDALSSNLPFYNFMDMDKRGCFLVFAVIRILMCTNLTSNFINPDEYWQGTEVAYNMVYGGVELPWEWDQRFRIRNVLYPAYLSIPLRILKLLGLDTPQMVMLSPYLAHSVLLIICDYYFYQLGKKALGIQATRVAMFLYYTNALFNSFFNRCLFGSVETVINVVVFNYYYNIENKFDKNLKIVALCLSIGMGIRATLIIGWIPMLIFKMIQKGAYINFIKTAFVIALPSLCAIVLIDSLYYGQFTITAYNFYLVNILENNSVFFGVRPQKWYVRNFFPESLPYTFHLTVASLLYYTYTSIRQRQAPLLSFFVVIQVAIFSAIAHKEQKFMIPLFPFLFLMTGQLLVVAIKLRYVGKMFGLGLLLFALFQTATISGESYFKQAFWKPIEYITANDPNPHSIYQMAMFTAPMYSLVHRQSDQQQIKILSPNSDPLFIKSNLIPNLRSQSDYACYELIEDLLSMKIRPKYIVHQRREKGLTTRACIDALGDKYELMGAYPRFADKEYWSQYFDIYDRQFNVYRLKKQFKPFY